LFSYDRLLGGLRLVAHFGAKVLHRLLQGY